MTSPEQSPVGGGDIWPDRKKEFINEGMTRLPKKQSYKPVEGCRAKSSDLKPERIEAFQYDIFTLKALLGTYCTEKYEKSYKSARFQSKFHPQLTTGFWKDPKVDTCRDFNEEAVTMVASGTTLPRRSSIYSRYA